MIIEGAHIFSEHQAIGAASTNSATVDLMGTNKPAYVMTWLFVSLTKPFTAGRITAVALQTGDKEDLSDAETVQTVNIPASVPQTIPSVIAQMRIPQGVKRYARLVYTANSPAGGTVWAATAAGVAVHG